MPVIMCVQEFFAQSNAEKEEGLPVTPFMDPQKITKPSSQCSFIGFVLLPLFEALGELFSELQVKYYLRVSKGLLRVKMKLKWNEKFFYFSGEIGTIKVN